MNSIESELEIMFSATNRIRNLLSPYEKHIKLLTKTAISEMSVSELIRISQIIIDLKKQIAAE